ncbi:MAG: DUF2071 domain-containing protein [Candidatus Sumerlaeia bacterium]|nr:DUF2071 domain-containing protein [Candidatus Sumerlaeia bacterium]
MESSKWMEKELKHRLQPVRSGWFDIATVLHHFVMVTYTVEPAALEEHLPGDDFTPEIFEIDGKKWAMVSAVFFLDLDFHFVKLPFIKFKFAQTNYRAYVRRRDNGKPVAWFFGTTLGGWPVRLARGLWRIPWHRARYTLSASGKPTRYRYQVESDWAPADIDVVDTGKPLERAPGFPTGRHLELLLTHPIEGYYHRLDGRLGTYSIRHPLMRMTVGKARNLQIPLFSRLNLVSGEKQNRPHSIAICPRIPFHILMPPVGIDGLDGWKK